MNKIVCFYHADADGMSAAYVVNAYERLAMPDIEIDNRACNYDQEPDLSGIDDQCTVYIVDFGMPIEQVEELIQKCIYLYFIDHHATSSSYPEKLNNYANAFCEVESEVGVSAAMLVHNVLFPKVKPPEMLTLISKFDTWDKSDEKLWESEIYPCLMGFEFNHDHTSNLDSGLISEYTDFYSGEERELNRTAEMMIKIGSTLATDQANVFAENAKRRAFEREWQGFNWICLNTADKGSMQFDAVYDPKKHDGMMTFGYDGNSKLWWYGLYSDNKKIHCGELCKKHLDGGGHPGAAGGKSTKLIVG